MDCTSSVAITECAFLRDLFAMDMKIVAREKMRITVQRRSNAAISISGVVAMACAYQWKSIAIMWWIAQIKVTRIASLNQARKYYSWCGTVITLLMLIILH